MNNKMVERWNRAQQYVRALTHLLHNVEKHKDKKQKNPNLLGEIQFQIVEGKKIVMDLGAFKDVPKVWDSKLIHEFEKFEKEVDRILSQMINVGDTRILYREGYYLQHELTSRINPKMKFSLE